jgi:sortase A
MPETPHIPDPAPSDPSSHAQTSGEPAADSPSPTRRRVRRNALIGTGIAAVAGLGLTAALWSQSTEPASAYKKPATAAPHTNAPAPPSDAPQAPDPLTVEAGDDAPVGGDPKTPDNTGKADDDATKALTDWSGHNPAASGDHAVGPSTTSGAGGTVHEVLRIPALGKDWAQPVYDGVGDKQLRAGIGHFPGTERPGQVGNYVLAGHRSGVASPAFHEIDNIKTGTPITVTTKNRITYTYTVTKVHTVAPTDVNVIAQVPGQPQATPTQAKLTLVTCWPANGHSKRVVVEADLATAKGGAQ